MTLESQRTTLHHQNHRRLKLALFSTITLLVLGGVTVTSATAFVAARARAQERQALELARQAEAEAAQLKTQADRQNSN